MHSQQLYTRTFVVQFFLLLCLAAVAGRVVYVQVYQAPDILTRVAAMRLEERDLQPLRGGIVDREGRVLAQSHWRETVVANPLQIQDKEKTAAALAEALGMTAEAVRAAIEHPAAPAFTYIKRHVSSEDAERVRELSLDGIALIREAVRTYPQGNIAANLVGFIGGDEGGGLEGLELYYDEQLRGTPGSITAEFTARRGLPLPETIREYLPPVDGSTLVLTIDAALQMRIQEFLNEYTQEVDAQRATVIVMDVHTGEILALAMTPNYDINHLDESTPDMRRAWPITDVLSPGSVFKIVTAAAAIDSGKVHPDMTFTDEGYIVIQGVRLNNWDGAGASGPQTIAQLLQRSSNVGAIKIGQAMGPDVFWEYMVRLGLTEPTGIDFPGEGEPYLGGEPDTYTPLDWANMYIGQRFLLSDLQVVRAVAAVINGGKLVKPHLVREIRSADGRTVVYPHQDLTPQVLSPATSAIMREFLVSVVEQGTAGSARTPGYRVGGKTGTAEKFENGIKKERMTANFIGFAPADDPRIVMMVSIDEPAGQGYGGVVAAPVFRTLLPEVMRTVGIPPEPTDSAADEAQPESPAVTVSDFRYLPVPTAVSRALAEGWEIQIEGEGDVITAQEPAPGSERKEPEKSLRMRAEPKKVNGQVVVPNLAGMTLTEAVTVLESFGLTPHILGNGYVYAQSPYPGTLTAEGTIVTLMLASNPD